jgi:hypothetical protein
MGGAMMAKREDPTAQYRVKLIKMRRYWYACTQPPFINPETGKRVYQRIQWGRLDENLRFIPGRLFYLASPEERAKLIFPDEWDMSLVYQLKGLQKPG